MIYPSKAELLQRGIDLMHMFCGLNQIPVPAVDAHPTRWPFSECAFYRPTKITINPVKCAEIGVAAQCWSYPGYKIDRTPYGVIQHELGHHVDWLRGQSKKEYGSEFSTYMRQKSGEEKLTNYCPNDMEWFAEMFRLFMTNPGLLEAARPKTHRLFRELWTPVETRTWQEVLADAPVRTQTKAAKLDW